MSLDVEQQKQTLQTALQVVEMNPRLWEYSHNDSRAKEGLSQHSEDPVFFPPEHYYGPHTLQ